MLIIYAALIAVPQELEEAARLDGASWWQTFWRIRFPYIRPVWITTTIMATTFALRGFDIPYLLTNGGPGQASELLTTYMYKTAFVHTDYGYASAISVFIVVECLDRRRPDHPAASSKGRIMTTQPAVARPRRTRAEPARARARRRRASYRLRVQRTLLTITIVSDRHRAGLSAGMALHHELPHGRGLRRRQPVRACRRSSRSTTSPRVLDRQSLAEHPEQPDRDARRERC